MSDSHGNSGDHGAAPAEPHTPMWLPAVGAVLFLTVGLIWGLYPTQKHEADAPSAADSAADAGSAAPTQPAGH